MASGDQNSSRRSPLVPSFVYNSPSFSSSYSSSSSAKLFGLDAAAMRSKTTAERIVVLAPKEGKIRMYSPAFYASCTVGGILSCGLTHTAVTPLDLVKCNMQVSLSLSLSLEFDDQFSNLSRFGFV